MFFPHVTKQEASAKKNHFLLLFKQKDTRNLCTYREMNKGHSQQHRQQDSQSNRHHHDVTRQIRVVAKQQLRLHIGYKQETSTEKGKNGDT